MRAANERGRCERALLGRRTERRSIALKLRSIFSDHHAVVLPISTAARRQIAIVLRSQREERRGKWQAQKSQQRDGKKLPQ